MPTGDFPYETLARVAHIRVSNKPTTLAEELYIPNASNPVNLPEDMLTISTAPSTLDAMAIMKERAEAARREAERREIELYNRDIEETLQIAQRLANAKLEQRMRKEKLEKYARIKEREERIIRIQTQAGETCLKSPRAIDLD